MNESNRKRQRLQQLEGHDNNDNHSIAGTGSELSFNSGTEDKNTIGNDGNELKEMKLKMAALESKIALLEAKNQTLEGKLANQQELNAKMHVLAEENKKLVEKLKESEQKAQMVKNELEEINQTCRQKLEKLTSEIAKFKEEEQKTETTTEDSPCLRLLPLETWTEMFGFVPRPQLGELVPQIGDWRFAEKAQYFLHEYSKATLGQLRIVSSANGNRPIVLNQLDQELPLVDVPMPENVKNFMGIHISDFFGESVLQLLQQFHRNSLFANVNINLNEQQGCFDLDELLPSFIAKLLPLFTTINSVHIDGYNFWTFFQNDNYSQLTKPMLTSSTILTATPRFNVPAYDWFFNWLYTPREDGQPRILILNALNEPTISPLIERVKKDFIGAEQAVNFFFKLAWSKEDEGIQSYSLENGKTNERLVIKEREEELPHFVSIARYQTSATEEWIEAMGKVATYNDEYHEQRYIEINM